MAVRIQTYLGLLYQDLILLCRQARRRFGLKIAAEAEPLLATITDLQQLEESGDLLLSSPDGPA